MNGNPINPQFPSVMAHDFGRVPIINAQRSAFKCPSNLKTMFDSGKLIPIKVLEILPGDSFTFRNTYLCRLTTPLTPFMDNLYLDVHHFFCPSRLLWSNWNKFMGEKASPGDSTSYTVPVVSYPAGGWVAESLGDYMGIPILKQKNVNALPFRMYNFLYNEFYKDQNIINAATVQITDGPDSDTLYTVRRRGKRPDYFTTCLPNPQEGSAVTVAFAGTAPVLGISKRSQTFDNVNQTGYDSAGASTNYAYAQNIGTAGNAQFDIQGTAASSAYPNIRADLSAASALTIAAWRQAMQLQAIAEINARGGHRLVEIIYNHFQVAPAGLAVGARPEYLGGHTIPIYVTPVPQTSKYDTSAAPTGKLGAYAAGIDQDFWTKSFTEHGYVMSIVSVRADLSYQQGLNRMWSRSSKNDFFWPLLQNIGDQSVLTQEIYLQGTANPTDDASVFGYQERYGEYKFQDSLITGKLRSTYGTPLDYWHLSQKFTAKPTLSQTFIEENPPVDRVVAVTTEPQFVLDVFFDCTAVRPMAMYSIPGFIGRF